MELNEAKNILTDNGYTLNESAQSVYIITGIVPYSDGDRVVIAVYLDAAKAHSRYNRERAEDYYCDVDMEEYDVDEE